MCSAWRAELWLLLPNIWHRDLIPEKHDILHCLAGMLRRLSGPSVIGGDFNGAPEELEATAWLKFVGGKIHRPAKPTCGQRCLDFFVVSGCISGDVHSVERIEDNTFAPHHPVRLYIKAKVRRTLVRSLAAPKPFDVHSPHGPLVKLDDLPTPDDSLNGTGTVDDEAADAEYKTCIERIEQELASLAGLTGKKLVAHTGRADGVAYK